MITTKIDKDEWVVIGTTIAVGCLLGGPIGGFVAWFWATPHTLMAYDELKERKEVPREDLKEELRRLDAEIEMRKKNASKPASR